MKNIHYNLQQTLYNVIKIRNMTTQLSDAGSLPISILIIINKTFSYNFSLVYNNGLIFFPIHLRLSHHQHQKKKKRFYCLLVIDYSLLTLPLFIVRENMWYALWLIWGNFWKLINQ